ncbi:BglG family transcription antiterminator [Clostridium cellulovorans]|uniref:Transcriptional antiterminator, BglG n=1 Tax=Clostridium cellulovorans (strain ATCC 35296 / DSM 3052 / OCM 3 / 743B) TaxID=573061 RepID=D9SPY7_CLOC7|nr:BglG family transcription antiterminator [Clostridium cellulovorans]ADL52123.1 transcriptional antiterminator, BglG [Clostridium cellulovorans 743B]
MNNLTPRQQFVLNKVLYEGSININSLERQLNVSSRTILREIASLNAELKKSSIKIFNDEKMDLNIAGNKENIQEIKASLNSVPVQWLFTKEQRQIIIACELLVSKEPLKASYFSHKFNVVMGSISLDLDSIEKVLITKNLCLIKKRSYGISIGGSEWNKRNAFVDLLFEFKTFDDLLSYFYNRKIDSVVKSFFEIIFGSKTINLVKDVLNEDKFQSLKINDVKYLSFFIQVLLAIKKTENSDNILLPQKVKEDIRVLVDYESIKFLDESLKQRGIVLPEDELGYLYLYLSDYKYLYKKSGNSTESDIDYGDVVRELVTEVSKKINSNLSIDDQLIKDLTQHFKQTFYTLNLGVKVINPLINEIEEHYSQLFEIINEKCKLIFSRYNLKIPREEVGYITMHIEVAIQRQQSILKKIKVLIVCSGGIATSRIINNKIKSLFPDIEDITIGSLHDINDSNLENKYDLILATVPVMSNEASNIIEVSPFLTQENIEKISNFIFNLKVNAISKEKFTDTKNETNKNEISNTEYEIANSVIKNFQLEKANVETFVDLINHVVDDLADKKFIKDKEVVRELIFKREEKGNVVVPGSNIALIHTRSDEMSTPLIGVYRLEKSLSMGSVGFTTEDVDTFLVLLARNSESNYILQMLGKVSSALIEYDDFVEMLKIGNLKDIRDYLINIVNIEEDK